MNTWYTIAIYPNTGHPYEIDVLDEGDGEILHSRIVEAVGAEAEDNDVASCADIAESVAERIAGFVGPTTRVPFPGGVLRVTRFS